MVRWGGNGGDSVEGWSLQLMISFFCFLRSGEETEEMIRTVGGGSPGCGEKFWSVVVRSHTVSTKSYMHAIACGII